MTKAEKTALLQAKAQALINWFEARKLPEGPVKPDKATTITNTGFFVTNQVVIMQGHWDDPYNPVFVNAYQRLNDFKTFLDAHD